MYCADRAFKGKGHVQELSAGGQTLFAGTAMSQDVLHVTMHLMQHQHLLASTRRRLDVS
jgi:hypothetical protein